MTTTLEKMAIIQEIFIDFKQKGLEVDSLDVLGTELNASDSEFRSIAYEAASMGIALKNLQQNNSLKKWLEFYQKLGQKHDAQVHVGLGWAFAELNLDVSTYLKTLEPLMKYRVLDGFSYYEGKFKRRKSVRNQETPANLDTTSLRAYNQGLGRSFWYLAQGEIDKLTRLLNIFPEERQFDMWRGVGVAVAYVGGLKESTLDELVASADQFIRPFKCGIAIAAHTRNKANAKSEDTNMICQNVLRKSVDEIAVQLNNFQEESNSSADTMYFDWIKTIENQL
jgi:hypothetical protein